MIRLVASDLDGTLLYPDGNLPEGIFDTIEALHAKGVLFVAASGRQHGNLRRLFAPVKDKIAFIAENGAIAQDGDQLWTVPIAEECFYRGLIFRNLYDKSPFLAYAVSMVIFSLAHVLGYVGMEDLGTLALCFLQYLPAAFALAWSYRRSGSIFAPILIHMVVNQTGMLLMR